jgi:hypothetical protein
MQLLPCHVCWITHGATHAPWLLRIRVSDHPSDHPALLNPIVAAHNHHSGGYCLALLLPRACSFRRESEPAAAGQLVLSSLRMALDIA